MKLPFKRTPIYTSVITIFCDITNRFLHLNFAKWSLDTFPPAITVKKLFVVSDLAGKLAHFGAKSRAFGRFRTLNT